MGSVRPRSALPSWASLKDTSHDLDSEVYRCCMTELQLQAIVNQQGIEGSGESNLDLTTANGVTVSKWHLDSVTYGKEVSERVFNNSLEVNASSPTQNGAPRIMKEFLNKPYRFELRDEYAKGPNPRPLPTIKAMGNLPHRRF